MFVCGGLKDVKDIDPVSTSYVIEGYQGKVTHSDSMITMRYKHEVVYTNGCVYALGGYTKDKILTKNVEKYDFQVGEWERMPQMHFERVNFTALVSQSSNSIYVFGG